MRLDEAPEEALAEGAPSLPPLLTGRPEARPFEAACRAAADGADPGTLLYYARRGDLAAGLVLAPEVPLEEAMAMWPACGLAIADALVALGPPELAVGLSWDGAVQVNGARCGRVRASAATRDPAAVPDWLVVGFEMPWALDLADPGLAPDRTALLEEGFADLAPLRLLESWSRHMLVWMNHWEEGGARPLHAGWRRHLSGLGGSLGRPGAPGDEGAPIGLDERFGMILRGEGAVRIVPLSSRLEPAPEAMP